MPSVRLVVSDFKKLNRLYLRARAVFSTSTMWLVFPDREGTEWVTVPVVQSPAEAETPSESPPQADSG